MRVFEIELFFAENTIFYAIDSPKMANYVYRECDVHAVGLMAVHG